MTKHSPFSYFKPGPGFLNRLAQARGPGTKSQCTIGRSAGIYVLPVALLRLNWGQMPLLGPRSVDQRQGLLCLIPTVEPQDLGAGPPVVVPRVSDHGPLVLGAQICWGVVLFGNYIFIHLPISS
mgnify:CR=1 FL=1